MAFAEDELLPISALQHWAFCERQAALIHLEREWAENRLTTEGKQLHERAHSAQSESRPRGRTVRSLQVRSERLGLIGVCDIVEFLRPSETEAEDASTEGGPDGAEGDSRPPHGLVEAVRQVATGAPPTALAERFAGWTVRPVEYKRGKPKKNDCDRIQLAAQAICLEEMLQLSIPTGLLFYGETRRRTVVEIDVRLRARVEAGAARLREIFRDRRTPPPIEGPHCLKCSLHAICMPELSRRGSARAVWERRLKSTASEDE